MLGLSVSRTLQCCHLQEFLLDDEQELILRSWGNLAAASRPAQITLCQTWNPCTLLDTYLDTKSMSNNAFQAIVGGVQVELLTWNSKDCSRNGSFGKTLLVPCEGGLAKTVIGPNGLGFPGAKLQYEPWSKLLIKEFTLGSSLKSY